MRYELTDLRLFLAIAEARGLSAGAAAVHLTAPAASYRLKNLEHAVGTPLFERTARGMDLTPAGQTMLHHVRELFEGIARMQGDMGRHVSGLKGHIRMVANSSSLTSFITPSLGSFLQMHPDVNIDLEERQSEDIPAAVAAREADIGIYAGSGEVAGLRVRPYAVDELVLALPTGHPLLRNRRVAFDAALDHDFVCMSRSSSNFLFLRDTAHRLGRPLRARLHVHGFQAVLSLVQAGAGIALVPRSVVPAGHHEQLATVALAEPWAHRALSLAVREEARLPAFVESFVQYLLDDPLVAATRQAPPGA